MKDGAYHAVPAKGAITVSKEHGVKLFANADGSMKKGSTRPSISTTWTARTNQPVTLAWGCGPRGREMRRTPMASAQRGRTTLAAWRGVKTPSRLLGASVR